MRERTKEMIESKACSHRYKTGLRGKTYNFSRVFDGKTTQDAYFDATAGPMVTISPLHKDDLQSDTIK